VWGQWIAPAIARIVVYSAGIQALCWIFGYFDECTACVKEHRQWAIPLVPAYFAVTGIIYDRRRYILKKQVQARFEDASKNRDGR
jgi:hypothetical protein